MKHVLRGLSLLILATLLLAACAPASAPVSNPEPTQVPPMAVHTTPAAPAELILATTTSTQDSGLLDYLLPMFEKEYNVKFKVIAVGSGQAIQLGKDGNADVLLVHSPAAEKTFMDNGDGIRREDVMYNDFVLIGPDSDPAKISGMKSVTDAFKAIADTKSTFVSRGDQSGTNTKELAVWKAAQIEPKGDWYVSAG